jgi:hypothetical protein
MTTRSDGGFRANVTPWLVLALVTTASACSTTPYKEDISTFKTSVDQAATAFESLDKRAAANSEANQMRRLAKAKAKVDVRPQCLTWEGGVEKQIEADISCLAAWSRHRSLGLSGSERPTCKGASDSVKQGADGYYDFASLRNREAQACELLVDNGDSKGPTPVQTVTTLLSETPQLSSALRAYASALADIANAEDREALNGSVAEAKVQLLALADEVDKGVEESASASPKLGPISDLMGSALIAALERRRLKALQSTTSAADPIVRTASVLLSNASVPLTYAVIMQSKRMFLRAMPGDQTMSGADGWERSYNAAVDARTKYLGTYRDSPIPAFQAMAVAHTKLTEALADPDRQYEAVKAAILDFASKAKAARDAEDEAKETSEQNK